MRLIALLSLVLGAASPLPAQLQVPERAVVRVEPDRTAYQPGESVRLSTTLEVETGWHVNANPASYDYLIPTEVEARPPDSWPPVETLYPEGSMQQFSFADEPISVYDGTVTVVLRTAVPREAKHGAVEIPVQVTYQACDDRHCLPPVTKDLVATVTVGPGGEPTGALAATGVAPAEPGDAGGAPLALMLLLGAIGGLILNVMPCVLPVLSIKLIGLVKGAGQARLQVITGALATTAGILLSFWALAGAAIAARGAGVAVGWGVQFQQPVFVTVLAVVVTLFCLNLWGLFEIPLPQTIARVADAGPREGLLGHLGSGLFATLMATPCSAPFLGTAVGFGLTQPAATVLAVFTAVGVGFALPYLALALFPGVVHWLPRPGVWMERVKVVMGYLLAATLVWLLYVLSSQVSPAGLAFIELSLLGLALSIWLWQRVPGSWSRWLGAGGALLAIVIATGLAVTARSAEHDRPRAVARELIEWRDFDRAAAERLAASGRLVFVDVTADWCFTCKVNERLVLETPQIASAFERYEVVAMKADWTNRNDRIARFLADHGRYGIPFYLLYRPGREPHLFSELISRDGIVDALEASTANTIAASR